ncbi:hypothetical protein GCM10020331_060500 [Ectobacillus funiculus]
MQNGRVIIEEFIRFDSEITLLTVRTVNGTLFCPPIGHIQKDGDYIESWQPHYMTEKQIQEAKTDCSNHYRGAWRLWVVWGRAFLIWRSGVLQ